MKMKNVYAILIACFLFSVLFLGEIGISLYFWTEENYELLGYIGWALYPIFLIACGFVSVKYSASQKWWFSLVFASAAYVLVLLLPVIGGTGLNFTNWGISAIVTPVAMLIFSGLGGGIHHYVAVKH